MSDVAVSFLSTAYRTEPYVDRMIRSVLAQTVSDWELVIVDNGMSDEIVRIVGAHTHDPRIRLLRQENSGPPGGVNTAGAAARGRHVAVLNSDDAVLPEFCARTLAVLDADPGVAAVACDAEILDAEAGVVGRRTYLGRAGVARGTGGRAVGLAEVVDGPCPYYTGLVRRDVWAELGGYTTDAWKVTDLDAWLRLLVAGHRMVLLPEVLCRYRESADSISRGGQAVLALEEERERVLVRATAGIDDPAVEAALRRALRRSRHRRAVVGAKVALQGGDGAAARKLAAQALRERADARTLAIAAALTLAPRAVAAAYDGRHRVRRRLAPMVGRPDRDA